VKIVVTANGPDLEASTSPVFGRCPEFVLVDTETMSFESISNPGVNASGGAGIQAAQLVVDRGAKAVISGRVGPKAFGVLQAAHVVVYSFGSGTVREAVEAYKAGSLSPAGGATGGAGRGKGRGGGGRGSSPFGPTSG
jgi:predicted Fe-Mo cluster-binding NifX family protein